MILTAQNAVRRRVTAAVLCATVTVLMSDRAVMAEGQQQSSPATVSGKSVTLDRVIAVVNGDVILESDVDEERRFEEIQPYRSAAENTREKLIERLVDRTLILQQAAMEPEGKVSDTDLDAQIAMIRRDVPACKEQYHCETDEGWAKYLGDHGFTVEEFRALWLQRMQLLKFIEVRFRSGITISDDEIKQYYEKTMLPEYARRNVKNPPPLDRIKKRIEEVLLQQQVSALLEDWLKSLRAEGSVQILTPGEVTP